MDTKIRNLERQAARGDEQARLRLYQTYERMEMLGGLRRLTDEMRSVIVNGKAALVAAMQNIIASYPITGFVYEATHLHYGDGDPDVWFVVIFNPEVFPQLSGNRWWNHYWAIGPDHVDEFDLSNIPEYLGLYGKPDKEVAQHLSTSYGQEGNLYWGSVVALRSFRTLFGQYHHSMIKLMMGGYSSWACNAEDIYFEDPDRADAMQGIYQGLLLEEYREKRARKAQLRQELEAHTRRVEQERQQLASVIDNLSDEQRQNLLANMGPLHD